MSRTRAPHPQAVIAELRVFLVVLFEAFESAVMRTREFFEQNAIEANPFLEAHLLRTFVADFLRKQGHDAVEFDQDDLPNSGIQVRVAGYQIRMWKSEQGELPPPGRSSSRQRFCTQILEPPLPLGDLAKVSEAIGSIRCNLALLWGIAAGGRLPRLFIAMPKRASRRAVETYWVEAIPHPAQLVAAFTQPAALVDETDSDLPIALAFDEEQEHENPAQLMLFTDPVDDIPMGFADNGQTPNEEVK